MRTPEKTVRLAAFFTGLFPWIAVTGLAIAFVRLSALASPRIASRLMRRLTWIWSRALTWWAGAALRVRVIREGEVPPGREWIVASNHQSVLDIPIISSTLWAKNLLFIGKEQMRYGVPNVSPAGRYAGFAFISRRKGDGEQIAEIERLGAKLGPQRASAMIFVEGTRSRDGRLGRFKAGGLEALLRAAPGARLLPVAIDGTWQAASFASLLTTLPGLTIRVRVGSPIEVGPEARQSRAAVEALAERVRGFCGQALAEWRGEPLDAVLLSPPAEAPAPAGAP